MNNRMLIFFVIIAVMIVALFSIAETWSNNRLKLFVENGYTRKSLPGYDYPQWIKEDSNDKSR